MPGTLRTGNQSLKMSINKAHQELNNLIIMKPKKLTTHQLCLELSKRKNADFHVSVTSVADQPCIVEIAIKAFNNSHPGLPFTGEDMSVLIDDNLVILYYQGTYSAWNHAGKNEISLE